MARLPSDFLSLDQEPKCRAGHGPPPAYRTASGTVTETDTWSDYSGSSGLGKRRTSWVNLVESDENLNKHKVNCYPKVKQASHVAQQTQSRAPSQLAYISDNYHYNIMSSAQALPLKAAPMPAGTLPPGSVAQSRTPSVVMAPTVVAQPQAGPLPLKKRNRLQEWRARCGHPCCGFLLFLLVLAVISGIIAAIILSQVLKVPKTAEISWLAPEQYRAGQNQPVKIEMKADNEQVRFQMQGAMPFKGNYISYYDFKTNRVAVIDETLKTGNKTCFVMPLDRSNLHDADAMRRAAAIASKKTSQTQGWDEKWQYLPSPLTMTGQQMFNPAIPECVGARWIQLDYVGSDQKNRKCSDCYDFCLPDYGIEKDTVRNEEQLNIVKRICFYLFVPEWRTYAQANNIEQNQRDFETYYRNRNHLTTAYGGNGGSTDSKWIQLQQVPQTIQNLTGNLAGQLGNAASQMMNKVGEIAQGIQTGVYGQHNNYGQQQQQHQQQQQQQQQQQNYQNGNGYGASMQPNPTSNGMAPSVVNGVVNLNGVNGHSGQTSYNMNTDSQSRYGTIGGVNGLTNGGAYQSNGDRPNMQPNMGSHNMPGAFSPSTTGQQGYVGQYGSPAGAPDQRDLSAVPYTNGNGFGAQSSINRPPYPDANGINPPSGYVPQSESSFQGISGMQLPPDAPSNTGGYRPDVMPNPQYQQQLQQQQDLQQQMAQQRWNSG